MHELAITEGIVNLAVPEAEKQGARRIITINLKLGELSDIVPSCIEHYLQYAAAGTIAEGAKIAVTRIPIAIKCRECGWAGEIERHTFSCKACGSENVELTQGREYFVESLEVE